MLKRIAITIVAFLTFVWLASLEIPISGSSGVELTSVSSSSEAKFDGSFRVDNFNVQRGKGNDGVRDLNRSIEVLKGVDIAGIQELSGTVFYGWQDQATQMGEQLGLGYLYAPTTYRWLQPNKGSALFSRFPVLSWKIDVLPKQRGSRANPRNLIQAEILIDDKPVTLLVTHLDRRESNELQLNYVLERFAEVPGPVILMADLNTDHFNETLMSFIEDNDATDAVHESIGQFWRLDWIITRGFDVIEGGMTPRGISDHGHYWARLKFSEEQVAVTPP